MHDDLKILGHEHSFIGCSYISHDICDGLLDFRDEMEQAPEYAPGMLGEGAGRIDSSAKDSMDISINPTNRDPRIRNYLRALKGVSDLYMERYPYLKELPWSMLEGFNIQKYNPGQGYHAHHTERGVSGDITSTRCMVWMTYLNDVEVDGGTRFVYYDYTTKPRKGMTLIWPADWTHLHHGVVAPEETKIIVTGWYNYIPPGLANGI